MKAKKTRDICIIGLGRFGHKIAEQLLEDKTNNIRIALVDKDEKHLLPFKDEVNSIYILDAAEKKALEAINIADFDVVIIATSDNIEIAAALNEIGIKKSGIESGKRKVLLADSSKFSRKALAKICDLQEFDIIITDSGIDEAQLKILKEKIARVIIV